MMSADERLLVGKIAAVHGVRGWLKIDSYTEPRENLFEYQPWYVKDREKGWRVLEVDQHRIHGKRYIAHLRGVDDRDRALDYCHREIYVDKSLLPELGEDEFYHHQLQGLRIYSLGRSEQEKFPERLLLGAVTSVMETGANDVLVVSPSQASIDERERLLPWHQDHVRGVDLHAGEIEVIWDPDF